MADAGQEAGYNHRLKFFEKDPIVWKASSEEGELYKKLFALKASNTALWNAHWGPHMVPVVNSSPNQVLSFVRKNDKDEVFAVINFSGKPQTVTFKDAFYSGKYTEYFSGEKVELGAGSKVELKAWGYQVYVK